MLRSEKYARMDELLKVRDRLRQAAAVKQSEAQTLLNQVNDVQAQFNALAAEPEDEPVASEEVAPAVDPTPDGSTPDEPVPVTGEVEPEIVAVVDQVEQIGEEASLVDLNETLTEIEAPAEEAVEVVEP